MCPVGGWTLQENVRFFVTCICDNMFYIYIYIYIFVILCYIHKFIIIKNCIRLNFKEHLKYFIYHYNCFIYNLLMFGHFNLIFLLLLKLVKCFLFIL